MHAVHHPAFGREDDREAQIRSIDQSNMLNNTFPTRRLVELWRERLANLTNVGERNLQNREVAGTRYELINVPR